MNTKEKMQIMQAYLDGKPIQYKLSDAFDDWIDYTNGEPSWTFGKLEYRVKPEDPAYAAYKAFLGYASCVNEKEFKESGSYKSWQAVVAAVRAIPE